MSLAALARPIRALYDRPYILLVLTTLFWGGNVVAGRLAVGEVSPMLVVLLRWFIAFALLAALAPPSVRAETRALAPKWPLFFIMGAFGYTGFNALFYAAAHETSGVNIAIIQGSTPIAVLLMAFVVLRTRLTTLQLAGAFLTTLGVLVVASHGDWRVVVNVAFNRGDLWLLIASLFYAVYTLLLKKRPPCSAVAFFAAMALAAFLSALPLVIYEAWAGQLIWPGLKGWALIAYIAIFPSLVCQIAYIRAIELIGPGRASVFYNLVPIFGALLSTLLLGEPVSIFDALALAMVLGGIYLAEKGKPDAPAAS